MRRAPTTSAALLVMLALAPGCTRSWSTAMRDPLPPRAATDPLAVYAGDERPPCPYDELGVIAVRSSADSYVAIERSEREARALGADAVLILRAVDLGGDLPVNAVIAIAALTHCPGGAAPRPVGSAS